MEAPLAWLAVAVVIASTATVGTWYRQTPRDWPETVALMVHIASCAALLGLLRWAWESGALEELAGGVILGWGLVAIAVALVARES